MATKNLTVRAAVRNGTMVARIRFSAKTHPDNTEPNEQTAAGRVNPVLIRR